MKKLLTTCRFRSFSSPSIPKVIAQSCVPDSVSFHHSSHSSSSSQENNVVVPQSSSGTLSDSLSNSLSSSFGGASDLECSSQEFEAQSRLTTPCSKRYKILVELVASETAYTSSLRVMMKYYKEPLKSILSELEMTSIFSISELIYDFHCSLLSGLTDRVERWNEEVLIGAFLVQMVSFLRSYSAYVNNYTLAMKTLVECEKRDQFQTMMASLRNTLTDDGRILQSLTSYLMIPIQRIPRYLVLLETSGLTRLMIIQMLFISKNHISSFRKSQPI